MEFEKSTSQFYSFFTISSELMAILNEDGHFLDVNPAWEKNLGFSPPELKQIPFFELIHEKDLSHTQLEIQKLFKDGKSASFENQCRRKDQTYRWFRWNWFRSEEEGRYYLTGRDITDLKAAEKALAENQAKFKRLSDSAKEGIAIHDKGIIVEANQALATLMGYQHPDELIGVNGMEFPAPEFRPLVQDHVRRGYDQPYEAVMLRKDGTRFDCMAYGKPIQYQGRIMRVTTFLDITTLKKREQELFESQELFRKLADASMDGIAVSEMGKLLVVNPTLAKMFGCEVSEMVGRNAIEFAAPQFRDMVLQKVMGDEEKTYELMGLRKDGSRFPLEITARLTSYQGRRVRVAFFRDISQRKKIEEEVQRQKDFSQNLINSSLDGFLAFDQECRYTVWNPAMERISGHSREEVIGQCAFDAFPFLKQIGEDKYFYDALAGKTGFSQERPYRTPAGRQGYFEASYMPIKTTQGQIIGGLGIIHEVTERKKALEALRLSELNLKAVFNNTLQNIVLINLEGRIIDFNQNAAAFLKEVSGLDAEKDRDFFQYVFPSHQKVARERFEKALQGELASTDRVIPLTDGSNHWYEVSYNPVFGKMGEIEGVCFTCINIDERKSAEEALLRSENSLKAIFNSVSQSVILLSLEGIVQTFNNIASDSFLKSVGRGLETGVFFESYIRPEDLEVFRDHFRRAKIGGRVQVERSYRAKDGVEHWFEYSYNPVFNDQKQIVGVCFVSSLIDGRKKAEEALQRSENNLKGIFNSVAQSVVLLGPEGVVRTFNKRASDSFKMATGRGLESGTPFESYLRPEDHKRFQESFRKAQQGERLYQERLYRMEDGTEHWFEYSYIPVLDDEGQITGVCFVSSLIDERKKAEESLRRSEADLRAVFNSGSQVMVLIDQEGRIKGFNSSAETMSLPVTGHSLEKGMMFADTLPSGASREMFQKSFRDAMEGRGSKAERSIRSTDGQPHWVEVNYQPVFNKAGEVEGVCFALVFIDERKKAEEALRESEEKFRKIFEGIPIGMTLVDQNFKFLHVNQAFSDLVGYSREELAQRTFKDITHPDDLTANLAHAADLKSGKGFRMQKRYLHKNGGVVWADLTVTGFLNEKGELLHSVGMIEDITERKRSERLLQESEEKFRKIFEDASMAIAMVADYRFIKVNKAFQELLGYSEGEIMGKTLFEITHPDDLPKTKVIATAVHDGKKDNFKSEKRYLRKDGESLWANVSGTVIRDGSGTKLYSLIMIENISDRKKAQEALQETQERFERLVQVTQEGILIHENPNVIDVNPALASMMGYSVQEMIGKSGFDFLAPESHETAKRHMVEGSAAPYEALALRKNGSAFPVELRGRNFNYKEKELRVISVNDLTWRKEAERILTESEDRYRRLVELSPEAVVVHAGGKVLYVNPAGLDMFGASGKKVEGLLVLEFLHPQTRGMAMVRVKQIMETGEATDWVEQKLVRLNGEEFPAETKGTPFLYQGTPSVLTIVRDITERKKTQQTLLRYERLAAVGKVIAAIAHEIRNPLTVVSGMSQILKAKLNHRSEFSQELATILAQTDRLRLFMNDILDYSREMEIKSEKVELQNLFERSLVVVHAQIGSEHVKIEVKRDWTQPLPECWADGERLEQVLINLILNAYQSMKDHGVLTLSCHVEGEFIHLGVKDDGPGIPDGDKPHLFEPFFTTKKNGSGLGLPICQKIIEAHGGKIEVQKIEPHGTLFTIQLPVRKNT